MAVDAIDGEHAVGDFCPIVSFDHGPGVGHGLGADEGEVRGGGFEEGAARPTSEPAVASR